jgi:hypothetical protein
LERRRYRDHARTQAAFLCKGVLPPSTTVSGQNQVFNSSPSPISTTKVATFVFYVRFDSFDNHSLDQMNLEAHLFTFKMINMIHLDICNDGSAGLVRQE